MKQQLLLILLFFTGFVKGQAPYYCWTNITQGAGPDDMGTSAFAKDAAGNLVAVGYFVNTVDIDPGPAYTPFTSNGGYDIFITKTDPNGQLLWAKQIGSSSNDLVYNTNSVAIDAADNIYVAGELQATGFIQKFDASGNLIRSAAYSTSSVIEGLTLAANGHVLVTGHFFGTNNFDLVGGTQNLTSSSMDGFVCRYDSAFNFVWADQFTGAGACSGAYIKTDALGNCYVSGQYFNGSSDINPGAGVYTVSSAGSINKSFLLKLNASGAFVWAVNVAGSTGRTYPPVIETRAGKLYMSGAYETAIFSLSSGGTAPNKNAFVAQMNPSTGSVTWIKNIGGGASDYVTSPCIAVDAEASVYLATTFGGTIDADPDAGSWPLSQPTLSDALCLKLDSLGTFIWAGQIGNTSDEEEPFCVLEQNGDVYIGGDFGASTDFDPSSANSNTIAASSGLHAFICKWSNCPVPQVIQDPGAASVCETDMTQFNVVANIPGVSYRWQLNTGSGYNDVISDAHHSNETTASLLVTNVQAFMEGYLYRCIIENPCGFDTSSEAALSILTVPVINVQPAAAVACEGSGAQFSIGVSGAGLLYQWYENNNPIWSGGIYHGADSSVLVIDTIAAAFSGNTYSCTVFNLCNSVFSDTVGLTVNLSSAQSIAAAICNGDSYILGTQTLTAAGNYSEVFQNMNGCDSTVNLALTVHQSYHQTMSAGICNGDVYTLGTQTLIASGNYTETFQTINGCDSVVDLALTVNSVNTAVSVMQDTLTASAAGAAYQWLDCNPGMLAIGGATNQQYVATLNGNYAVIVTENGCTDTSACTTVSAVGIETSAAYVPIRVYPNPATNEIHISTPGGKKTITVFDPAGKKLLEVDTGATYLRLDTSEYETGFYILRNCSAAGTYQVKLIIKK
jgi:hypothetical protein